MNLTKRYSIAPQLKDYDKMPTDWKPYFMFSQSANYISKSVNTDEHGQRYTIINHGKRNNKNNIKDKCDIIIGASNAFGVGATGDQNTIASVLSNLGEKQVITLAGRAYNSRQELILFLEHMANLKKIENIIIISGANNLYVSAFRDENGIPFFWSDLFYNVTGRVGLTRKQMVLASFFDFIGLKNINWRNVNKSNLFKTISDSITNTKLPKEPSKINVNAAAERTIQDLHIFNCLSKSLKFNLIFCLQPVYGWLKKPLSPEEEALFSTVSYEVNELMSKFCSQEVYNKYKNSLSKYCKDNKISFHDLNSSIKIGKEWFFVDRVHLTDFGYAMLQII